METEDTTRAFETIARELAPMLALLSRRTPDDEIPAIRRQINDMLAGAGLTWVDIAERVTAPR